MPQNYTPNFGTVGTLAVAGSRRAASSTETAHLGSLTVVTVTPASGSPVEVFAVPSTFDGDRFATLTGLAVVRALQVAAGN
jgi:hypothetical protein